MVLIRRKTLIWRRILIWLKTLIWRKTDPKEDIDKEEDIGQEKNISRGEIHQDEESKNTSEEESVARKTNPTHITLLEEDVKRNLYENKHEKISQVENTEEDVSHEDTLQEEITLVDVTVKISHEATRERSQIEEEIVQV